MPNIVLWDDAGRSAARPTWNPFSLLQELDAMLDSFSPAASTTWPSLDVVDRDDEVVVTADLPGMTQDDVEITMTGPILSIAGRRPVSTNDGARYVRQGRFAGSFARHLQIEGVDADGVRAELRDGVLEVRLPKDARARPRRIKLGAGVVDKVKSLFGKPERDATDEHE
jgi:HSP20 family protein